MSRKRSTYAEITQRRANTRGWKRAPSPSESPMTRRKIIAIRKIVGLLLTPYPTINPSLIKWNLFIIPFREGRRFYSTESPSSRFSASINYFTSDPPRLRIYGANFSACNSQRDFFPAILRLDERVNNNFIIIHTWEGICFVRTGSAISRNIQPPRCRVKFHALRYGILSHDGL